MLQAGGFGKELSGLERQLYSLSLWTNVPQKEGGFKPAFAAHWRIFKDHLAYTAVVTLVAGRELKARGRQDAGPVDRDTQACCGFLESIGMGLLASGFHVKGSFLLDNKFWSLKCPSSLSLLTHLGLCKLNCICNRQTRKDRRAINPRGMLGRPRNSGAPCGGEPHTHHGPEVPLPVTFTTYSHTEE